MSKNTTKQSISNSSMQLTQAQKEKFLEYLEKKGLPAPSANLAIEDHQSKSKKAKPYEFNDMFSWCADDIVSKARARDLDVEKEYIKSKDFENDIFASIFNEAVRYSIDNPERVYDDIFLNALNASDSQEDIVGKLSLEAETNSRFADQLFAGIIKGYLDNCAKLALEIDPEISFLAFN